MTHRRLNTYKSEKKLYLSNVYHVYKKLHLHCFLQRSYFFGNFDPHTIMTPQNINVFGGIPESACLCVCVCLLLSVCLSMCPSVYKILYSVKSLVGY